MDTEMVESGAIPRGTERPVSAPVEILDGARHRIRSDAGEAGQLREAGPCLVPRDAAALAHGLERLRHRPADRERAVRIHVHGHRDLLAVLY
jgi:hypothetical protein